MAKLAELVECLSEVLGMPTTAVEAYAKPLRKEGLISSSGRTGPGSPNMTSLDATNLLLAILGGSTRNAVKKCKEISSSLSMISDIEGQYRDSQIHIVRKLNLKEEHTLGEMVQSIIENNACSDIKDNSAVNSDFSEYLFATLNNPEGQDISNKYSEYVEKFRQDHGGEWAEASVTVWHEKWWMSISGATFSAHLRRGETSPEITINYSTVISDFFTDFEDESPDRRNPTRGIGISSRLAINEHTFGKISRLLRHSK
ncbi:hypothetical protein J2848_005664 [Azospirillum lipoferum]|uniref:Uncharacterized protein n=1 Tax=Azospirillum lipoferum TaxID=193 RepID=A0A5A9GEM1_AZOLI|nr:MULTISPECIES: hypothetical protein [Azospirillum]KAA0592978.1 hypothetical protein FZ942_25990 [Azospirillum lipoferum]MCP1613963.1 hypothetical protein [Azospirillum lipoferum]MDW5537644.1 hypothetical protein [Azospirillum sp. NL1]